MKKLIALFALAMLTMTAWAAKTVTLDFTLQGYDNQHEVSELTIDGVTVAFDKGTNSITPKYYTSGNAVRLYAGGTLTVSAAEAITGITFTYGSGDGSNEITCDVGTFESPTWTGEANEVVFTVGGTSGNRRFSKVEVTLGDGPVDPVDEEDVNIIFALQGYENAQNLDGKTLTVDGVTIDFAKALGQTPPAYYNTGNAVRLYTGNRMTVTVPSGKLITKIVFTYDSGSFSSGCVDVGEINNKTWTGEATSIVFTNMTSSQVRVASMLITLEDESEHPSLPLPVCDPADGTEFTDSLVVTITSPTEGAIINYIVNDGPMVAAPSPVTIVIYDFALIMGYAEKDGVYSGPFTATYYKVAPEGGVETLAAANALEDNSEFTFNGDAVVTVCWNGSVYLRDASGYGRIANVEGTFENGQVLNQGWSATKTSDDGWVKYIDAANLSASDQTDPELAAAQKLTGAVDESMINAYVYVENVHKGFMPIRVIPLPDGTTITLTGTGNQPATGDYNIYGIIWKVNGALVFEPVAWQKYVEPEPEFLRGDVNDDGNVKINDVTALINYLLSGDATGINQNAADCNQDGSVKIGDVSALINYLLNGSWD